MAKQKGESLTWGQGHQVLKAILDEVKAKGGVETEVARILTSKKLRESIAELIVGTKRLVLNHLKLVADGITVATAPFTKDSFFRDGPAKLYFWGNFENWVLRAIPETVPGIECALTKTELTKAMTDLEILSELGQPKPFSVAEFAAVIRDLIGRQSKGEEGVLLANGYANIFYVQLEDERVVAVSVYWDSDDRDWYLYADGLDAYRWSDGRCVFSRS